MLKFLHGDYRIVTYLGEVLDAFCSGGKTCRLINKLLEI